MVKRKPYQEGDWFAVPVSEGHVLGRIARVGKQGGILLGYFFEPWQTSLPGVGDTLSLTARDAFAVVKFTDLGLLEEGWPIVHRPSCWNRDEWPMPLFGAIDAFRPERGYAVQYDEKYLTLCLSTVPLTAEQALQFPNDGLSGHLYLQRRLAKYFKEGQRPYDPTDRVHSYTWYHGLP